MTVNEKRLCENQSFVDACNRAKTGNGRLHFLGLVSFFYQIILCELSFTINDPSY